MISEPSPIVRLRFITGAPDASVTGSVGAGVGLTQAKGLAAQVRALRRRGYSDEAISHHLKLAPGQLMRLISTVTKAQNAHEERLAHDGLRLPLGAKKALKLNGAEISRETGARQGTRVCDKGYAARIVMALTKRGEALTAGELSDAIGGGIEGVRNALKKLEDGGKVEKTGRFKGARFGAAGRGAVLWLLCVKTSGADRADKPRGACGLAEGLEGKSS